MVFLYVKPCGHKCTISAFNCLNDGKLNMTLQITFVLMKYFEANTKICMHGMNHAVIFKVSPDFVPVISCRKLINFAASSVTEIGTINYKQTIVRKFNYIKHSAVHCFEFPAWQLY